MTMQKATRTLALALVVVAVALAGVALTMLVRSKAPAEPTGVQVVRTPDSGQSTKVVVAARALPAGLPVQALDLEQVERKGAPVGAFLRVEDVVGRSPSQSVSSGSVLTENQFKGGLALALRPGERAIAIPVDELAGAGNRVAPGDLVDVFLSIRDQGDDPRVPAAAAGSQARLLLPRLRVLSYGDRDVDSPALVQGTAPQSREEGNADAPAPQREDRAAAITARAGAGVSRAAATVARSAVLAVPVDGADRLILAAQTGKLFLALRHPGDEGMPDQELFPAPRQVLGLRAGLDDAQRESANSAENRAYAGVDSAGLLGRNGQAAAKPQPSPAADRPIRSAAPTGGRLEIIRGSQSGSTSP
ncbi:pilus assembly protein CpaB [Pseudoxanthomonas sp. GM95]|uniref:Flp pilus assembly protein CpaB n=1 Tax=Pseudoxanthomonas sp. GM95 TaxID=1881043 RepID=UPI0008D3B634|nr:Flp pilus assembly protein CpaB [Pseudoxanthomonas sp. GM95]SEL68910.1 pilus assembly protein CpaB [Pseudoxanthomonas sp. GM95]